LGFASPSLFSKASVLIESEPKLQVFVLTRFLPQISLRNLRKLDCYANRYPSRIKCGTGPARKRYAFKKLCLTLEGTAMAAIDPLTAGAVLIATAATDAVYVLFTSAVVARKRVPAATWSSVWYLLSSYAVISYTENWVYVGFAAVGSWLGAFASITFLHRPPGGPPVGAAPE
jgi:hypothetical protein